MILEQINRKISEQQFKYKLEVNKPEIFKNKFKDFVLTTTCPNNYCFIKKNIPVKILKFTEDNGGTIIGVRFHNIKNFYVEPLESKTIGIVLVDDNLSGCEEPFLASELESKAIGIPYRGKLLLMPLLHCYKS